MTPRERLITAYKGGKPDRVPVFVRGVYPFNAHHCETVHESFKPLTELVREKCEQVDFVGFDYGFLYNKPGSYSVEEKLLSEQETRWVKEYSIETPRGPITQEVTYSKDQPSMVSKHWVCNDADLERVLSMPYVPAEPDVSRWRERDELIGDNGISLTEIGNAVSRVTNLLGSEDFAIWSITRRDELIKLIEMLNERLLDLVGWILDQGVGPVIALNGEEFITPPLHGPKDFKAFVTPYDKTVVDLIHSHDRIARIHCHGPVLGVLDDFLEIGVDALHPVEAPPLGDCPAATFREKVGNRICMKGNIQIGDLIGQFGPDEIREQVRKLIDDCGRDGALIIAPTASPYLNALDPEHLANYVALVEAAHEFGTY